MGEPKRSLSQTGGKVRRAGDPASAEILARCLAVDPKAKLPYTHGFHAYPARMHPETAREALAAFPDGPVLDPFVGSGTVALEAVRAGRRFMGGDIVPPAVEIAWARTRVWHPDECRKFETAALALVDRAWDMSERADVTVPAWTLAERPWYDPHTLREIGVLSGMIEAEPETHKRLLRVVLSSIVVKLSKQISDSDVKVDLYHRPRPRGAAFRAFKDRASELTKGLLQLSSDLYKRKVAYVEPEFRLVDARTAVWPKATFGLVLSSPPYAGTYDYTFHQDRRYPIFGSDPMFPRAREMGSRRMQGRGYEVDLRKVLERIVPSLLPGGRIVLQMGDGREGEQDLKVEEVLPRVAAAVGLRVAATASQRRRDWSGGPPRHEHLVLLESAPSGKEARA